MEGHLVAVEPLGREHDEGLYAAGHDREAWTYLPASPDVHQTREGFHRWMQEAFEQLRCERVELKCDARNARSRAAMEALPAQFEGIHRRHRALPDGSWRDTAWYSVIAPEWPGVRAQLRERLARHGVCA